MGRQLVCFSSSDRPTSPSLSSLLLSFRLSSLSVVCPFESASVSPAQMWSPSLCSHCWAPPLFGRSSGYYLAAHPSFRLRLWPSPSPNAIIRTPLQPFFLIVCSAYLAVSCDFSSVMRLSCLSGRFFISVLLVVYSFVFPAAQLFGFLFFAVVVDLSIIPVVSSTVFFFTITTGFVHFFC